MSTIKILMVTSEVAPLAKTGGLAEMVSGLSAALVTLGHDVRIVCPHYPSVERNASSLESGPALVVGDGDGVRLARVERLRVKGAGAGEPAGPTLFSLRQDDYFGRRGLYQESGRDYPDNLARFAFFCRAVVELMAVWERDEGWVPDVVHAHDWQAALVPVYLRTRDAGRSVAGRVRTMLTVHNVGYQGIFPASEYPTLGLDPTYFTPEGFEFFGSVNLLKGGVLFADSLTTVSPTYCREIQTPEFGFGLEGVFRQRKERLVGIVNGIDTETWNPETDPWLPAKYSASDLSGKAACKAALQRECGFPVGPAPLLAVVSRLVAQKGIDLVIEAAPSFLERDAQLVVLGTGEAELEDSLQELQQRHPRCVKVFLGFDEGLAHRIQAGADMFLVPSRYEPCGLTQLCSLRYGTVPIVRKTGGLADTVVGYSPTDPHPAKATGFVFDKPSKQALTEVTGSALLRYKDSVAWRDLVLCGMRTHVGWEDSAHHYLERYRKTMGR